MKRILFQGDSITDFMRDRDNDTYKGMGYVNLIAAKLGFDYPNEYEFLNRGVSGNRIVDLYARLKCDFINLKPDVLSILIGVNDVWHELDHGDGVDTKKFEKIYNMIIEEIKTALSDVRIIILEPFVLKGSATVGKWENFRKGVEEKAAVSKFVAEKNGLEYVPLMKKFDMLVEKAPADYWLFDGVHPTSMGFELIAREWIKVFTKSKT